MTIAGLTKLIVKITLNLVLCLLVAACAGPLVKTDLQTLQENPEQFEGKQVIVTADIESVVENQEAYAGKKVELTGYVEYVGFWASSYWNFILKDKNGLSVKCYERNYRVEAWIMPVTAMRRAARENGLVTVVGKLGKSLRVELDWVEFRGQRYITDYKPPSIRYPLF
jgi:hypothetical protein